MYQSMLHGLLCSSLIACGSTAAETGLSTQDVTPAHCSLHVPQVSAVSGIARGDTAVVTVMARATGVATTLEVVADTIARHIVLVQAERSGHNASLSTYSAIIDESVYGDASTVLVRAELRSEGEAGNCHDQASVAIQISSAAL